jgi:hypothetical protein
MAFPTSPTNGQSSTVNGITYVYTAATNSWKRSVTIADSVLTSTVDSFTGNGSNTVFTLTTTPQDINYTTAVVGGVTQPKSAYSVLNNTLTFTSAPANNQIIEVTTIGTSNTALYTTTNNIISPFMLMGV